MNTSKEQLRRLRQREGRIRREIRHNARNNNLPLLQRLEECHDRIDLAIANKVIAAAGERIPYEQVKQALATEED